jgi:hypothetical protein
MQRALLPAKAKAMADVLRFDPALQRQSRDRKVEAARDEEFSFWPEVSQGLWLVSNPQPVNPANGQGRVVLEMLGVLGAVGAIALAISLLVGGTPV